LLEILLLHQSPTAAIAAQSLLLPFLRPDVRPSVNGA
jgi:hypothetical protein